MRILACCLLLILLPLEARAHVPGASRDVRPTSTGLNTKAPDFVLLNQDGNRFDLTTLRGKVVVLNFIFTTCTDVCPLFTANLAQLQRTLKDSHRGDIFFISVTTDPEVDSPKVLESLCPAVRRRFSELGFPDGHRSAAERSVERVWHQGDQKRPRPHPAHQPDHGNRSPGDAQIQSLW